MLLQLACQRLLLRACLGKVIIAGGDALGEIADAVGI